MLEPEPLELVPGLELLALPAMLGPMLLELVPANLADVEPLTRDDQPWHLPLRQDALFFR